MDVLKAVGIIIAIVLVLVFFQYIVGFIGYALVTVVCVVCVPGLIISIGMFVHAIATNDVPLGIVMFLTIVFCTIVVIFDAQFIFGRK